MNNNNTNNDNDNDNRGGGEGGNSGGQEGGVDGAGVVDPSSWMTWLLQRIQPQQLQQEEREMNERNLDEQLRLEAHREMAERVIIMEIAISRPNDYPHGPELALTEEELDRCYDIVDRNNQRRDDDRTTWPIQLLTHYEVAQLALFTKDDVPKAMELIEGIQQFKRSYQVTDTVEQGMKVMEDFVRMQPGFLLAVGVSGSPQGSLVAVDHSKFFPDRVLASTENLRTYMLFWYYLLQICCAPNFDACRGGVQFLVEGKGVSLQNVNLPLQIRMCPELFEHLPLKFNDFCFYNTSPLLNRFVDLVKPFMTPEQRDTIEVGCRIGIADPTANPGFNGILTAFLPPPADPPELTLATLFLQPSPEQATQNLLCRVRTLMEERYNNERWFLLQNANSQSNNNNSSSSGGTSSPAESSGDESESSLE